VPIIYLSAEDDLDKQLDAMSEGGDDFLTKPIKPRHLIATVRTRAARARSLQARIVQDSLTGLYNHTHTLQLLDDACYRARREQQPLAFAMLDIDHFKKVNDTYGHPMGDRVIKSLALFLKPWCCPIPTSNRRSKCWRKFASASPKSTTRRNRRTCPAPSVVASPCCNLAWTATHCPNAPTKRCTRPNMAGATGWSSTAGIEVAAPDRRNVTQRTQS
jgi:hypothetical protein